MCYYESARPLLSRRGLWLVAVLALGLHATPALSQSYGIRLHAGTLGIGADIGVGLRPDLMVRVGGSAFGLSVNESLEDGELDLEGDVGLGVFGVLLDYHPGGLFFRFTVGALYNAIDVSATATAAESYEIAGRLYSPSEMGSLTGSASGTNTIAPYLGMGLGRAVPKKRVGFNLDVGALYMGSTDLEMSGTGAIAPTADQADDLEAKLKNTSFYPVVTLGLSIRLAGN